MAKLNKTTADVEYLAMMTDVEMEDDSDFGMGDEMEREGIRYGEQKVS